MDCPHYGARLERGQVVDVIDNSKMRVKSLERIGMVSRPMYALENTVYTAGTKVFFFMFDDGTGLILGEAYVHPSNRVINN